MSKVSIKEIAKMSGVSVATVSRVINNNGRFSEETRKKVLKVIEETGYNTNNIAKSLRMQKTNTIGIVVPDITNFFFADLVQKIEESFFEQSYSTIICNTGRNNEKEQLYLKMLQSKMIDGLIVISGIEEFDLEGTLNDTIPVIYIDRKPKETKRSLFISSDHFQGAYEATSTLLDKGCQLPIILKHDRQSSSTLERLDGFIKALKDNGKTFDTNKNIVEVKTGKKNISRKQTLKALHNFFEKGYSTDGIFSVNDYLAIHCIEYLQQQGIRIPNEVKIIGFDDSPFAFRSTPRLSSVKQNTEELASLACKHLLSLMNNTLHIAEKQQIVPVDLILRDTT